MVGLGFVGLGLGYWLLTYGFSQIRKQNAGFFQLIWPGAYAKNLAPPDGPAPAKKKSPSQSITSGITGQPAGTSAATATGFANLEPAPTSAYASPSTLKAWIAKTFPKLSSAQKQNFYNAYAVSAPFKSPS